MKQNKKIMRKRGEIYLTLSFGFVTPPLWEGGKHTTYAKKN